MLMCGVFTFPRVAIFDVSAIAQSVAMGGNASKCGAVKGLSQGLVCTASLVSQVYWFTPINGAFGSG
jgi:hypothetical protein